jgi:cytochrome b6
MDERFARIPDDAERELPPPDSRLGKLSRALLARYPVWPVVRFFLGKRVPIHRQSHWYMAGGIALFLFVVQIVTGILLMVYYRPDQAWASVNRIVMEVPYGALIRSVHHWAANLMIFTLFVHMLSTFFMKAYRPPRELTWVTGLLLLALTILFGFSGYLLPWDDLSFFAVRIGVSELEKLPLLGHLLADVARGGSDVSTETIGRFYALHVVVLPLAVLLLVGIHLLFVQVQGVSEPDAFRALPAEKKRYRPFLSDFLVGEVPVWLFVLGLLLALAAAAPRELAPEANPFAPAPAGIKPEWYLLAPYQGLKLFPGNLELVGMALMGLGPLLLVLLPLADRSVPRDRRGALVTKAGVLALVGFVAMTIWGIAS